MMHLTKMSGCLLACFASHIVYAGDLPAEKDFSYHVQKGDTLSRLTTEVLDTPSRWNAVAKYNKLHDANLIYPAQVLHIPFAWLKNDSAQARIEALTGEVKLNGQPAHVGDVVKKGDQLETASAASLRMTLPDGSTLNMLEKTQLEAKDLQQKKRGNIFSAIFRLTIGRIDALKKKYPDGQAPLHIEAMHGTIGVRGTHFRMGQEGENTLAEIEQGQVGFESDATQPALALAGGQGSVADGVHSAEVITLLPAPIFPPLADKFPANKVKFVMPETAGVSAYRGEVAKDEAFMQIVAPVSANGAEINIAGLTEGAYWLRLRAIDAHGLQGLEGTTELNIVAAELPVVTPVAAELPVVTPSNPILNKNQMLTGWQGTSGYEYELQIAQSADFTQPLSSVRTKANFSNQAILPQGAYFLRLRLIDAANNAGAWCEPVTFTIK